MPAPGTGRREGTLAAAAADARACRRCRGRIPEPVRPVFQVAAGARLLIVGQAPGRIVQETGIPWNDPSGDRLREWTGLDRERFYDAARVAIVPAGLCYPGRAPRGGDLPPVPECAPLWHPRLLPHLRRIRLTLLVGGHAQALYLPGFGSSLTDCVRRFREVPPGLVPLPHPSWRNNAWLARNPWFARNLLPWLRRRVGEALG